MLRRRLIASAVVVLAMFGLAACTPGTGVATPTPTELSDEAIYSRATTVLEEYTAAVNAIVVSDPATFEPAFALSTGKLNEDDRETYSFWHAEGWTQEGAAVLTRNDPGRISTDRKTASLIVCLDLSEVQVRDAFGASQVAKNRPDVQPLTAYVTTKNESNDWLLASLVARDGEPSC